MPKSAPRYDEAEKRIRNALARVATRPLLESEIEVVLHTLLVTGGDTNRRDYAATMKPATAQQSAEELILVAKAAEALHQALRDLHAPAAATIGKFDWHLMLVGGLAITSRAHASQFRIDAESDGSGKAALLGELPAHLSPKEMLAHAAALAFLQITGRWPTRTNSLTAEGRTTPGGDFIDFLKEVFAARGVEAGIESSAKVAIKAMDFHRQNNA
jgi:hypothetical protein